MNDRDVANAGRKKVKRAARSKKTAIIKTAQNVQGWKIELDDVDREIMRIKLEHPEMTQAKIGSLVGLSGARTGDRMGRLAFKIAIADFQKAAIDVIMRAKTRAALKVVALIDSPDDAVALKASLAICGDVLNPDPEKPPGSPGTETVEWHMFGRIIRF